VNILEKKEAFAYLANENLGNSHWKRKDGKSGFHASRGLLCPFCVSGYPRTFIGDGASSSTLLTICKLPEKGLVGRKFLCKKR